MNKAMVSACVAIGLVNFSTAAMAAPAEMVTEYGSAATYNGQQVRVFFTHNDSDIQALGIEVPAAMYDDAPMDPPSDGRYDVPVDVADPAKGVAWHCCGYEVIAGLPDSALRMTPFREVILNWNPQGHVPPGIYSVPHTDFHFYFMTDADRLSIGGAKDSKVMCTVPNFLGPEPPRLPVAEDCEQLAITAAELPADQMPAGYQNLGLVEPAMGNHLVDPNFHEFHGTAFDQTFIYMTNAGQLSGMEPMITLGFMRNLQEPVHAQITMPAAFPVAGMYPTGYVMEYDRDDGMFRVYYENWKPFPASNGLGGGARFEK